jgi:hypothetical protein
MPSRGLTKAQRKVRSPRIDTEIPRRHWTVLAQDPSILARGGRALTTTVEVPAERLERGPKGHRIHVVDYDATTDTFYRSRTTDIDKDIFAKTSDIDALVRNHYFHQQNVYALTMSTLYQFERALGRPVDWGFLEPAHQLKVAPHAYLEGNAGYSRESESVGFGYFFDGSGKRIYTCLSHDIVVHETTHALLDGIRSMYLNPSSPDQAGFHEGFADIVALLSVFSHRQIIEYALTPLAERGRVPARHLTPEALGDTALAKLGEEMGAALEGVRGQPLRHSVKIRPDRRLYTSAAYQEEHDRGELLVAVIIRAFLRIWSARLQPLLEHRGSTLATTVVAEEGGAAANQLLTMAIRALDYMPPIDMTYRDYLSALLTADRELYPDDTRYHYREALRGRFEGFGIAPASKGNSTGTWDPPPVDAFTLTGMHFERLQRDPTTVFRFVWENRDALGIYPAAFTRVTSVRPVLRLSVDGTFLRETVAEYVQTLQVYASELRRLDIRKPDGMHRSRLITLYGGGTLVFSEYGKLKFHIGTGVASPQQSARLQSLWDNGYFDETAATSARLTRMHRNRALKPARQPREDW